MRYKLLLVDMTVGCLAANGVLYCCDDMVL